MKHRFFLSVILLVGLVAHLNQAQLSVDQEAELTHIEALFVEFFKGSRIEELNPRVYNCLWTQNRMMKAFNVTVDAWNVGNSTD